MAPRRRPKRGGAMHSWTNRCIAMAAAMLLLSGAVLAAPKKPKADGPVGIASMGPGSTYIELAIDDSTGQFTMGVPGGVPLLFGHPSPWSSFSSIRVDGNTYTNDGNPFGTLIQAPTNSGNINEAFGLGNGPLARPPEDHPGDERLHGTPGYLPHRIQGGQPGHGEPRHRRPRHARHLHRLERQRPLPSAGHGFHFHRDGVDGVPGTPLLLRLRRPLQPHDHLPGDPPGRPRFHAARYVPGGGLEQHLRHCLRLHGCPR